MSSLRAWLTGRPKSSRATILAYWLSGNVMVAVLRHVPKHPTLEILRWLILALLVFLVVLIGRIVWTQRGRRK